MKTLIKVITQLDDTKTYHHQGTPRFDEVKEDYSPFKKLEIFECNMPQTMFQEMMQDTFNQGHYTGVTLSSQV